MRKTYMNRKNRDEQARNWKKQGLQVKRYSYRNQLLHPMYVNDYTKETGIELTSADCGLGNTIYKTSFSVIYIAETE